MFKVRIFFIFAMLFFMFSASLAIPAYVRAAQAEITETPTEIPTDIPTEVPTETPVITETPIETPTETPTVVVTESPTETPVITETPAPILTTPEPDSPNPGGCYGAWLQIQGKFKDVGYRFFDNPEHAWCQSWLLREYGIDYEMYKLLNP